MREREREGEDIVSLYCKRDINVLITLSMEYFVDVFFKASNSKFYCSFHKD